MGERSCPRSHHLVSKSHRSWRLPARRRIHQTHANPPACRGTKARCSLSGSFLAAKGGMGERFGRARGSPTPGPGALQPGSACWAGGSGCLPWQGLAPLPSLPSATLCAMVALALCHPSLLAVPTGSHTVPRPPALAWGVNAGGFSACTCPPSRSGPLCFPWKCLSVPFFPLFPLF